MAVSDYVTTAEFKTEVGITDVLDDTRIANWLTRAARAIDAACGREPGVFAAQTLTKYFDYWPPATGRPLNWLAPEALDVPPLITVTTLKTDEDGDGVYEVTWTAGTDYRLYPLNDSPKMVVKTLPASGRYLFPPGLATIEIVGSWGWAATAPANIQEAVILQALRYRARRNTPEGVMGNAEVGFARVASVDPDVANILRRGGYMSDEVFA